jgi:hypothetical protein
MSSDLNPYSDRPVFAAFLVDASGSMGAPVDYTLDVVAGHKLMLDTIRGSEKCHRGVLYVYQSLFAGGAPTVLHGFYALDRRGNDQVVALTPNNYRPTGQTALYDAILEMVRHLTVQLQQVEKDGFLPAARLAVITDGGENASRARREEVVAAISSLRAQEWLESSVVVGLTNPTFDEARLEELRESIGFSQKISLTREPRQIRRAFVLASSAGSDRP